VKGASFLILGYKNRERRSGKSVIGCSTGCRDQAQASRNESRWIEGFHANRAPRKSKRRKSGSQLPHRWGEAGSNPRSLPRTLGPRLRKVGRVSGMGAATMATEAISKPTPSLGGPRVRIRSLHQRDANLTSVSLRVIISSTMPSA
jgi:hypothetical protein